MFGDGGQTRDWVDVIGRGPGDLLAADSEVTGPVNVGHGSGDRRARLDRGTGRGVRRGSMPAPRFRIPTGSGEVRRSCLDVARAKRDLGWEAQIELREGLRRILEAL